MAAEVCSADCLTALAAPRDWSRWVTHSAEKAADRSTCKGTYEEPCESQPLHIPFNSGTHKGARGCALYPSMTNSKIPHRNYTKVLFDKL